MGTRIRITNNSKQPQDIGGRWVQPGASDVFDADQVAPEWRAGAVVVESDDPRAGELEREGDRLYVRKADGSRNSLVEAGIGPGGVVIFTAGARDIYPVDAPPSGENRLTAIDYLPYLALAENEDYVIGTTNGTAITRYPKNGAASSPGIVVTACYAGDGITLITTGTITSAWAWDDYQLIQLRDVTSGEYLLYKSVDGLGTCGANAPAYDDGRPIARIGWSADKSGAAASISIMRPWSLVRATNRRDEDVVVWGQYTLEDPNTRSHVFVSRDQCDTWECVLELNTGGTEIVRHCHAVQFDPFEREFWICYGDSSTSAYYVWDGVHPIAPNTPANMASQYKGWRGMDRFNAPGGVAGNAIQVTTLQFTPSEVLAPVDTGTSWRGVYSLSRDLTRYERITDPDSIGQLAGHALFSSAICARTGTMIVSSLIETGYEDVNRDYVLWVWAATPAGAYRDWQRVGRYMLRTTDSSSRSHLTFVARADGTFWIGSNRGAGKDFWSTSVCRIDGVATAQTQDDEIDSVHPVYWIDPIAGDDTTGNGYTPQTAWKTVAKSLKTSVATHGALIHVGPGVTAETGGHALSVNAHPRPAQKNYPAVIRGAGRRATTLKFSTIANGYAHSTVCPYRFESMSIVNDQAGTIFNQGAAAPTTNTVEFRDVYLDPKSFAVRAESGRTVVRQFECASGALIRGEYGNAQQVVVESGVHRGPTRMMNWSGGAGSSATVEQVTGIGQSSALVDVLAAAVTLPAVRNCAESGGAPVVKDARTVKTSADGLIEHNVASAASTGLVGGDAGSQVVADLGLIGSTGMPTMSSALVGAGATSASATLDIVGEKFAPPRNVGAWA